MLSRTDVTMVCRLVTNVLGISVAFWFGHGSCGNGLSQTDVIVV